MIYFNEKSLSVITLNLTRKPKFKKFSIRVEGWSTSKGPSWGLQGSYIDPTEGLPGPRRGPLYWSFVGSLHGVPRGPTQNFHTHMHNYYLREVSSYQ